MSFLKKTVTNEVVPGLRITRHVDRWPLKVWRVVRWIFPPYYVFLFFLFQCRVVKWVGRKVCYCVAWPFRKTVSLFSWKKRGRRFKNSKKGEEWATQWLAEIGTRRPMVDIIFDVMGDKQRGYSYISAETLVEVGIRLGLTLEEVVFILANRNYRWEWSIQDWSGMVDHFGVVSHKEHRERDRQNYLIEDHYGYIHEMYERG